MLYITRYSVLISAEGRWRIVLDEINGQEWLHRSLDDRTLKPSFLVYRPFTRLYHIIWSYRSYNICHANLAFLCVDLLYGKLRIYS